MPMLRHTPTGDMYVFTSQLAKRSDMELVEDTPVAPETPATRAAARPAPRQKPKPDVAPTQE